MVEEQIQQLQSAALAADRGSEGSGRAGASARGRAGPQGIARAVQCRQAAAGRGSQGGQGVERRQTSAGSAFETRRPGICGRRAQRPAETGMGGSDAARAGSAPRQPASGDHHPERDRGSVHVARIRGAGWPGSGDRISQLRRAEHSGRASGARHAGYVLAQRTAICCARIRRRCRCAAWRSWGRRCA